MRPKVSCIIPTYNRADYLVQAIDSVLSQVFCPFELIVVDDGSVDNTSQVVKQYGSEVKYLFQTNKGVSAARNLGLKESLGEYIAFLDSDDLWDRNKLLYQIRFMEQNPDFLMCYTEEVWFRDGVRVNQGKRHKKYSGLIFERCLPLCIISPSSALMRRSLFKEVGGFDVDLPAAEDYDLWLRITARFPVFLIPLPLIIKRGGHLDQLSKVTECIDRYRIKALVKIIKSGCLSNGYIKSALNELKRKCSVYGLGCKTRGRINEADYYLSLPDRSDLLGTGI